MTMTLVASFDFVSEYFFDRFVDKHHNIYIGNGSDLWKISAADGTIDKSFVHILQNLKGSVNHISYVVRLNSLVIVTVHCEYYIFLLHLDTLQVKQVGDPLRLRAWHFTVEQDTIQLLVTHSRWGGDVDGVLSVNLETGLQTPLSITFERFLLLDGEWISFLPADACDILSQTHYTFCNKKSGDRWTVKFPFNARFHSMHYHKSSKTLLANDGRTQFLAYHLPTRSISSVTKFQNQKADDSRFEHFFVDDQRSDVFVIYAKSSKPSTNRKTAVDIYRHRNILPHPLPNAHEIARWCRLLSSPHQNQNQQQQQRRRQLLHAIIFNAMGNNNKLSAPQTMSLYSHYSSRSTLEEQHVCPVDHLF